LAAAALVAGCDKTSSPTTTAPETTAISSAQSYVALGDSYTAAAGVLNQTGTPAGCLRSDANYPSLIAQRLKPGSGRLHDMSCSGATITDLTQAQSTDNGTNPAQISALSSSTTLALLRHGPDQQRIDNATGQNLAPCRASYTSGGVDQIGEKIQTVGSELASALTTIREKAPHARVYVVGYPELLPSGGEACARLLSITPADLAFLNGEEVALNAALKQRAEAAGDLYVDTYTPSEGHDACTASSTRWLEPWLPTNPTLPLHPNALR
jgi:hypothetical protein